MSKQIDIKEALDWYIWAGVTETCADNACLCVEPEKTPVLSHEDKANPIEARLTPPPPVPAAKEISSVSSGAIAKNAKDLCLKANTLEELRDIKDNFGGCNLKNTAAHTVYGDGSPTARLVLVGEAPGADEDRIGKPFVGRCGRLLDKMFDAIKIKREDCYITNVLPWRPPGNRTPTDEEIAVCLPFLLRQLDLIEPDFILLLGRISLNSVMEVNDPISRTRGKWMEYTFASGKKAAVLATYHPSYLLRSTGQKAQVWADLLRLKKKMEEKT